MLIARIKIEICDKTDEYNWRRHGSAESVLEVPNGVDIAGLVKLYLPSLVRDSSTDMQKQIKKDNKRQAEEVMAKDKAEKEALEVVVVDELGAYRTAVCNDLSDASYKRCANVECNRQFDPDDERQKYCGIKCQRKMSKIRRAKKKG